MQHHLPQPAGSHAPGKFLPRVRLEKEPAAAWEVRGAPAGMPPAPPPPSHFQMGSCHPNTSIPTLPSSLSSKLQQLPHPPCFPFSPPQSACLGSHSPQAMGISPLPLPSHPALSFFMERIKHFCNFSASQPFLQ